MEGARLRGGGSTTGRELPAVGREEVLSLVDQGCLRPADVDEALRLAGLLPGPQGWLRLIDRLLLGLGAVLLAAGFICLVAFNWERLGHWPRFGLAQLLSVSLLVLALRRGLRLRIGAIFLIGAAVLIGPMLALIGQAYQSGAEVHDLLIAWAGLALPWIVAAAHPAGWLIWIGIVQGAVLEYWQELDLWDHLWLGVLPGWLLLTLFNLALLMAWESGARRWAAFRGRLGPRLIAVVLLGGLTALTVVAVTSSHLVEGRPSLALAPLVWAAVLAGGYLAYRVRGHDLLLLSLGWVAMTAVLLAWVMRMTHGQFWTHGLLISAVLLILSSTLGRSWLNRAASEARALEPVAPDVARPAPPPGTDTGPPSAPGVPPPTQPPAAR